MPSSWFGYLVFPELALGLVLRLTISDIIDIELVLVLRLSINVSIEY